MSENSVSKKEEKIIFHELIRNFLLTSPLDIVAFLLITIIIGFFLFLTIPTFDFYFISLLYFSLLVGSYLIYSFLIKPILLKRRYDGWSYYKESEHDTSRRSLKQLLNRIEFIESACYKKCSLKMKMGELNSRLWGGPIYIDVLKKLIKRGVTIEILIEEKCDVEDKEVLRLAVEGQIKLYKVSENVMEKAPGHFMLTDRRGVWISDYHPPFARDKKGRYSFGPCRLADEKEKIFKELKSQGILVNKENITDFKFVIHDVGEQLREADDCERKSLFRYLNIDNKSKHS